jgi:predicted nucleotidyltransferase
MIHMEEKHLKMVKNILHWLVPDCEVRVFGSRHAGSHWRYSDLDLAIVGKKRLESGRLSFVKDVFGASTLPFSVDVLDWNAISSSFQKIIEQDYEVIQPPSPERV